SSSPRRLAVISIIFVDITNPISVRMVSFCRAIVGSKFAILWILTTPKGATDVNSRSTNWMKVHEVDLNIYHLLPLMLRHIYYRIIFSLNSPFLLLFLFRIYRPTCCCFRS
ncbi:hypothetical protein PENTCL1PPCAC_8266, partial [Pristionchus entomophagus]